MTIPSQIVLFALLELFPASVSILFLVLLFQYRTSAVLYLSSPLLSLFSLFSLSLPLS